MTKEQKFKLLFEQIYAATQRGVDVTFVRDSPGQVAVKFRGNASGHIHAGTPGGDLTQVADALGRALGGMIEDMDVVEDVE